MNVRLADPARAFEEVELATFMGLSDMLGVEEADGAPRVRSAKRRYEHDGEKLGLTRSLKLATC